MIAVQTLNLYKYYDTGETNSIRLQLTMSLISSYLLRKHYDKVILYADKKTAEMLSDSYYTEIRILPTDILVTHGYGTLAKLYTYSHVEEEYIHFDVDYFLFNKIDLQEEILCSYSENREKCGKSSFEAGYSGLIDKLKLNYSELGFNIINENYAMNMCVFGVPKIYHKNISEYFKKLNEHSEKNIEIISKSYSINYPPLWAIEQYIPAQYFLEKEYNIKELNEYDNYDIKGHSGYIRIYNNRTFQNITNFRIKDIDVKTNLSKYMQENTGHHLWNSKHIEGMDNLLMHVSNEMFPELHKTITFILEKHFLISKQDSNNKSLI
jgi:hypothetical protein